MAEVKVKITAQNEVRTGLQQALQETQKFSQQAKAAVSQSITTNPFAGDDRLGPLRDLQRQARELRDLARAPIDAAPQALGGPELAQTSSAGASAIRGLAADLANATSAGDVFEAVVRRITTAFGGLVAAAGGFAIGSLIRRTLEDAAAGLNQLIDQSQALQNSFGALSAPTTSFDQLAAAINGAAQQIEALQEANRKLQSGIGFQIADYINSFDLSAAANAETEAAVGNARGLLGNAILNATRRELELAKARTEEERKLIELQANREQFLAKARGLGLERQALQLFEAQDRRAAAEQREKTGTRQGNASRQLGPGTIEGIREFERAQEAARRALGDEFGPGTADAAAGGFRVDAAEFARQQGERLAAEEAAFRGSAGASALQRIGFASNEFFDTRQKKDPAEETRRAAEFAKQILDILKKGEPLVLPSTN